MSFDNRRCLARLQNLQAVTSQVSRQCFVSQRHFFLRAQPNTRFLSTVRLRLRHWVQNNPRKLNEIDSLQIITYTKEMEEADNERCSICLSRRKRNEIIVKLPCRHLFHSNCFERLIFNSTTCPLCRRNFYNF